MARKAKVLEGQWGGQWSVTKLDSVEKYLESYLTAMKKTGERYGWRLVYIDAFSGSGSQHIKVEHAGEMDLSGNVVSDFLQGSAIRALAVTESLEANNGRGFDRFEFIDKDQEALETLKDNVAAEHDDLMRRCTFHHGDSNVLVPQLVNDYDWRGWRGVIFIDPFHANFNRDILKNVASTQALDVWFLFPLSAIGRMLAVEGNRIGEAWTRKLDDFFGTHEWYETLYTQQVQPSLFEGDRTLSTRNRGYDDLLLYTKKWLQGIFGEANVLDPLRLDGANNSPLFALFAAISSKNDRAIGLWRRMAKYILEHA